MTVAPLLASLVALLVAEGPASAPASPSAQPPGSTTPAPPRAPSPTRIAPRPAPAPAAPTQGPAAPPQPAQPTQGAAPPPQPAPTAPAPAPAPASAGLGLGPPPAGLPPAPFFLLERSYFDVFVLRREDLLRWQPVYHPTTGWAVLQRPTTTTTLEFTKGPLRSVMITSVAVAGVGEYTGSLSVRAGLKVPRTNVSVFGGALPGLRRGVGLAGRF